MDGVGHSVILSRSAQKGSHWSGARSVGRIRKDFQQDRLRLNGVQGEAQSMSLSRSSGGYEVQVSREMDDPEWDAFLRATPGGSYQQTSFWARAKSFVRLRPVRVVIKHSETIVAGAQMLIRRVRPLGAVGYVTRGPLVAREHPGLARQVIEEL